MNLPVTRAVCGAGRSLCCRVVQLEWFATGRLPSPVAPLARRLETIRARRHPAHEDMPVALLGLELRRLGGELQADRRQRPAREGMRLRACTAAYDYVLLECCSHAEVPVPATHPLTQSERFNAEVLAVALGLSW